MKKWQRLFLGVTLLAAMASVFEASTPTAQVPAATDVDRLQRWVDDWLEEKAVTLKVPLYSLEYTMPFLGRATRRTDHVTRIAPKVGIFYLAFYPDEAEEGPASDDFLDANSPEGLRTKVATRSSVLRVGGLRVNPPPPVITSHQAGTQLVALPVVWETSVDVRLYRAGTTLQDGRSVTDAVTSFEVLFGYGLKGEAREFADLEALIRRILVAPESPPTPTPPAKAPTLQPLGLTKTAYDVLAVGMQYSDVSEIIGRPGEEVSRAHLGDLVTIIYVWRNPDGSNLTATFQRGRLVTKAQAGLK